MKKNIFLLILVILIFVLSCKITEEQKLKNKVPVLFEVSSEHRNYFFDFPKESFTNAEMNQIFLNRNETL